MNAKEIIQRLGEKSRERKELLNRMDQQVRMERIVQERSLSSNERELLRYRNEDREKMIKEHLEYARKKRQDDINFSHNPIDAENIIAKKSWEVLKEKNQFSKKSDMFTNQNSVLKNDNKLLRTNKNLLKSNNKLLKGGSMFKI